MKLALSTWQRIMLWQMVGGLRGDVALMRRALPVLEILELSEADQEAVGLVRMADGQVRWADEARIWELEVDQPAAMFLMEQVGAFRDWPAGNAAQVLDLARQLGL